MLMYRMLRTCGTCVKCYRKFVTLGSRSCVTTVTVRNMGRKWTPAVPGWLVAQRGERLQEDVAADISASGHKLSRTWLSRIENGAKFGDDLYDALVAYYKSVPPPYEEPVAPDADPSLAIALKELAAELRASREERESTLARLRAVEAELRSLRDPQGGAGSPERSVPPETAG